MNTKFLLKALPHALANEQACLLTDIAMPTEIIAGEDLGILIAGATHEMSYQVALELVLDYLSKDVTSALDGFYPVAHLHREDILSHHGHYVSSQLSEEDIENLAYNFWDDSFAESYGYTQEYLLESHHPDLVHAPEKLLEDRLANELCVFTMSPQDFDQSFILSFISTEVVREDKRQDSFYDTGLIRRFMTAMQVSNLVPEHVDYADVLNHLDRRDYQRNFMTALYAHARKEFEEYNPDIQSAKNQICALLEVPFKAGLSVSQALEKWLPKIKADLDENRVTQAEIKARRDYDSQRSSSMSNHLNLCDPISDNLLAVKITGDKDGIHLGFPDLNAENEGIEYQVTLEYRDGQMQVVIKNVSSQTTAQVIPLISKSS